MSDDPLDPIRQKIDSIDKAILDLIEERARCALSIAKIKSTQSDPIYYRPEREAKILREILTQHDSLLDSKTIARIFKELISGCLNLQKPIRVAYLGPKGTFSQIATEAHFGQAIDSIPQSGIDDIFDAVLKGSVDYGVVPIENSTAGSITLTLDQLIHTPLHICGEIELPIHHQLIRRKGDDSPIQCIYAHEQTLMQCHQTLKQRFPDIPQKAMSSNSLAAPLLLKEQGYAMIGASLIAEQEELEIVHANIEDSAHNRTRFIIIGKQSPPPSGDDKTSLLIATPQSAGALATLITPFQTHDISMTSIHSRPYQYHNWSYLFFIDIEGHEKDKRVQQALNELSQQPIMITILGSYPRKIL